MEEETKADKIINEIGSRRLQEAIDAGFTKSQAKYLVSKLGAASLGIGGLFL